MAKRPVNRGLCDMCQNNQLYKGWRDGSDDLNKQRTRRFLPPFFGGYFISINEFTNRKFPSDAFSVCGGKWFAKKKKITATRFDISRSMTFAATTATLVIKLRLNPTKKVNLNIKIRW